MLAINNRVATSTGLSPFFMTHGYNLDLLNLTQGEDNLRTSGSSPIARGEAFVARLKEATIFAQATMAAAQEQQEEYANRGRQAAEQFRVGDKVWLHLKNIKTQRPSKKLDWLNAKYTVTELVGSHACRLDTPPGIHNVFHISQLRRAGDDPLPSQVQDDTQPPAIISEDTGEEEWEVEKILDVRKEGRGQQALVKWAGYAQPTWEPLSTLLDTEALDRFEAEHGKITEDPGREKAKAYLVDEILDVRKRGRGKQLLIKWTGYPEPTWEPLRNFLHTDALARFEETHGRVRD
jgi:hypothetical protein